MDQPLYEIHLSCGDTINSAVEPRLGVYRFCIHCDGKRRVVGIQYPADRCQVCQRIPTPHAVVKCAVADISGNPFPICPLYQSAAGCAVCVGACKISQPCPATKEH